MIFIILSILRYIICDFWTKNGHFLVKRKNLIFLWDLGQKFKNGQISTIIAPGAKIQKWPNLGRYFS